MTSYKGIELLVGTSIVATRSHTLAFSLDFEFFGTKSKECCRISPDALQVVLQMLGTHRSIFVEQYTVPLFDFLPKGFQALVYLLVCCLSSLHTHQPWETMLSLVVITTFAPSMAIRQRIAVVPSALVLFLLI